MRAYFEKEIAGTATYHDKYVYYEFMATRVHFPWGDHYKCIINDIRAEYGKTPIDYETMKQEIKLYFEKHMQETAVVSEMPFDPEDP